MEKRAAKAIEGTPFVKKAATGRRSPLQDHPLRYAGQSLDDQIKLANADLISVYWVTASLVTATVVLWIQVLTSPLAYPWILTVATIVGVIYAVIRIRKIWRDIDQMKLGRDGEKIVAETLDSLKQEGAVILHDVVGDGFNLDHVICSNHGIFVVETKTRTKPARGNPTVVYDGNKVLVDGIEPDRNPIEQAMALAKWLEQTLLASTNKRYAVRPVIVFPGWWVESKAKGATVWVLNPKALVTFVRNEPTIISDSDLHLAVFHLTRYIRTSSQ